MDFRTEDVSLVTGTTDLSQEPQTLSIELLPMGRPAGGWSGFPVPTTCRRTDPRKQSRKGQPRAQEDDGGG